MEVDVDLDLEAVSVAVRDRVVPAQTMATIAIVATMTETTMTLFRRIDRVVTASVVVVLVRNVALVMAMNMVV